MEADKAVCRVFFLNILEFIYLFIIIDLDFPSMDYNKLQIIY